ncbi:uncharacterized protein GGS22DRAFT_48614 [Annulohypoxylon maeteangense]|uniref:uncharacterized protein n=1 Tax=Annulohypoxylon maeteangense TaxID=1927788 RepID=UPI002007C15E|nr:uncharacterized protein GGS22DRAFT_48614 [Annulohypoxylon maeteangense]KAI0882170.1 hypothetical protein GGS22DRAFT_48614 [Annulohypoxylon maeteangense]
MTYKLLRRNWRSTRAMYYTMIPELLGTVAVLVMFGISQPDLYRTKLWRAGSELGFNSSPSVILWAYANYEPQPTLPFVWSQTLTNFNVAISVLSLFLLLTKLIAFIMHVWFPIIALVVNISLIALYVTSLAGQAGPDYLDPQHPSRIAWYIAKPCTVAANLSVQNSCRLAKGGFAAACIMLGIYAINLGLNIWALLPNEDDRKEVIDDDNESTSSPAALKGGSQWEMHGIPQTPRTGTVPFTPRTMAFNTLERKLPLRNQYS